MPIGPARTVMTRATAGAAFSPAELSPDIWLEMDGPGSLRGSTSGTYTGDLDDETAILAALEGTEFCSAWNDLSGNARHFTQATTSKQPKWLQDSETNFNLPSLDFNITDVTGLIAASALNLAGGASIAMVFEADDVNNVVLFNSNPSASNRFTVVIISSLIRIGWYNGSAYVNPKNGAASAAIKYVMQGFWDGSSVFNLYLNGAELTGTGQNPQAADVSMTIGFKNDGIPRPFDGRISACIVKAGNWSAQRTVLDNYLATKYGVTF